MFKVSLNLFDFSKKRVRYDGVVLDKCALSNYIHQVAFDSGYRIFPLVSDIYWDTMLYSELKDLLLSFVNRCNNK